MFLQLQHLIPLKLNNNSGKFERKFLHIYIITSLNLADDLLTDKGEEPDEQKLKELTKEILEEKIKMLEQYLK